MADGFQSIIDRVGGWRRVLTLGVGVAAIALIVAVSRWATAPTWVPVASGVALQNSGEITDQLDQAGIPFQLGSGGSQILVSAADLARARVVLARSGVGSSERPGLELFDKPAYAMTDFTQRINYRRALEGELERTIGKMRGIESAQVHLALHETSSFRAASTPSEASVVLKLRSGEDPPATVVQGIAHLVASSVDGLESERVTIVDDAGRLLSVPNEPSSPAGLTNRQLASQREVERHLREKAEELLTQMVGRGNARVEVSAALNFDRLERTVLSVDPERQVATTEQKAEIIPGAQGGAASSNTATTYENTRSTEVYAGAVGTIRRLTVAVLVNDKMTGTGDTATVTPRTAAELARIDALVRTAVGYDSARGDVVSVASMPFVVPVVPPAATAPEPSVFEKLQGNQSLIVNVAAVLFAFVIGFMALKSIKAAPAGAPTATNVRTPSLPGGSPAPLSLSASHTTPEAPALQRMVPELAALQANAETRQRVSTTINEQPEVAAKLARAWLKES